MARVLVVDDALMMRKAIGTMLTKAGHVIVDEAANGEQAVQAYKKHRPDIVTMDITMPGVDGITALTQIAAYDPEAKVIMVSALGQKHKVFEALQNGAKSYILKPLKEDKLISTISEVLGTDSSDYNRGLAKLVSSQVAVNQPASQLQYLIENRDGVLYITILKELTGSDFAEFQWAVLNQLDQCKQMILNLTYSNSLNTLSAGKFADVMSIILRSCSLRVICYTRDYTMFFRNESSLQNAEFELVKKQAVL
ncbi:response regulator [Dendrosporobacter sp. 1207_IL3150]|uniref:response regulator n=1 Tax=Dendrosporobacter sp. 1207_IL3150 TaxID=3084054 RepID=UPI002FD9F504